MSHDVEEVEGSEMSGSWMLLGKVTMELVGQSVIWSASGRLLLACGVLSV